MNDSTRWRRVGDLFAQALERRAADRASFVHDAAAGDVSLEAELLSLLEAHERASTAGFMERPAAALDPTLLEDAPSPLVGRTVGPYVIRSELGRGGMGIVFYAEDLRLGRAVALKAVAPDLARDPRMRERLRREARAAAALSHPAIATVYALEELDGDLYIATEYVEGRTLREEIAASPLAPEAAIDTARAIAGALAAAHARGIIHRDLKPDNIIRRADGQLKVTDFGLARHVHAGAATAQTTRLTVDGRPPGTPGYMAPEQLRGDPGDMRTDVYAFGVLMYEVATGRHPYEESEERARLSPPLLDRIVRRCLRPSAHERYGSAVELLAALTAEDDGAAVEREPSKAFWWWQFHQAAVAAVHAGLVAALWPARSWFSSPWGRIVFYAALALQTAAVTMRLHLWFSSRFERAQFDTERRRVRWPLFVLDLAFQALLLSTGLAAAGVDAPVAPVFFITAIASFLALVLIEPATTRGAFKRSAAMDNAGA